MATLHFFGGPLDGTSQEQSGALPFGFNHPVTTEGRVQWYADDDVIATIDPETDIITLVDGPTFETAEYRPTAVSSRDKSIGRYEYVEVAEA